MRSWLPTIVASVFAKRSGSERSGAPAPGPAAAKPLRIQRRAGRGRLRGEADRRARGSLAFHVSRAEQAERERLAHVLHDDVQQVLAAARLHASFGSADVEVAALIDQALTTTRRLAHDLSPRAHADSFEDAVDGVCRSCALHFRAAVRFEPPSEGRGGIRVDDVVASVTLAALRELLFNAVRHAPGASVRVQLDAGRAWARVRVSDDGPGFDVESGAPMHGLTSVRRRIEAVGGHFDAWSSGEGARVTLCVPARD